MRKILLFIKAPIKLSILIATMLGAAASFAEQCPMISYRLKCNIWSYKSNPSEVKGQKPKEATSEFTFFDMSNQGDPSYCEASVHLTDGYGVDVTASAKDGRTVIMYMSRTGSDVMSSSSELRAGQKLNGSIRFTTPLDGAGEDRGFKVYGTSASCEIVD